MHRDTFLDELRRIEREVAEGERLLAEQEEFLVTLKKDGQDISGATAELEATRASQRLRQQDRQRLLSLLQP